MDAARGACGESPSRSLPCAGLLKGAAAAFAYPEGGISSTLTELRDGLAAEGAALSAELHGALRRVLEASGCFHDGVEGKLAYTRLFIGSLKMEAPPYASYYLEEGRLLNGAVSVEVRSVYEQFGLQLAPDEVAPADHLRYLLSFLYLLAARFEETGEGAFAEAYEDFRDLYVLSWYPRFQALVEQHAEHPYYPALVSFIGMALQAPYPPS